MPYRDAQSSKKERLWHSVNSPRVTTPRITASTINTSTTNSTTSTMRSRNTPMRNGTAAVNVQTTYSYEQAERSSVNSAYTHMTLGLIVTAVVAIITQMSGAYLALIQTTGIIGIFAPAVIEIVLAIYLGARIHTMKVSTAYVMFYVYAALMGFTLSTIFMAYDLAPSAFPSHCAPLLLRAHHVRTHHQDQHAQGRPHPFRRPHRAYHRRSDSHDLRPRQHHPHDRLCHRTSALRRMTVYDAQATRAMLEQYSAQGPEMVKKVSILCALNLYLDFVNMFMYILQLLGNRD